MTPEEIRKFAIEIAAKLNNSASADWLIAEAKKIEEYLTEKSQ